MNIHNVKTTVLASTLCSLLALTIPALAEDIISKDKAIEAALGELGVAVLGIRFDEPDTQWDVFVQSGDQAYEVEVDAKSGKVIAAEAESLEEVKAELAGDLSHEGVEGDID